MFYDETVSLFLRQTYGTLKLIRVDLKQNLFSESIKKSGSKMDYIDGNHHFFVNQYEQTARAVDEFLN